MYQSWTTSDGKTFREKDRAEEWERRLKIAAKLVDMADADDKNWGFQASLSEFALNNFDKIKKLFES